MRRQRNIFLFLHALEVGDRDAEAEGELFHCGGALFVQASDVFGLFADETAGAGVDGDAAGKGVGHFQYDEAAGGLVVRNIVLARKYWV